MTTTLLLHGDWRWITSTVYGEIEDEERSASDGIVWIRHLRAHAPWAVGSLGNKMD